jgi:molybdate transport system ATP-binding protein
MSLQLDIQLLRDGFELEAQCELADGMLGVYGPSGSGKSTLLHLLAGLVRPTTGSITLNGTILADPRKRIFIPPHKRQVSLVFQDNRLWPRKTVLQNISYGYQLAPGSARKFSPGEIASFLQIEPLLNRQAAELSGGEQKRVAIARAILCFPKLLLLDEPTAGLDPKLIDQILPLLKRVAQLTRIPMIIVSHQLSELLSLTDHLLLMRDGKRIAQGRFMELVQDEATFNRLNLSEPVNVLPMVVDHQDAVAGLTVMRWRGSAAIASEAGRYPVRGVIEPAYAVGQCVNGLLRPSDITLAMSPAETITMQNRLPGVIQKVITQGNRHFCMVQIHPDAHVPGVLVEVTQQAICDFALRPGLRTWCLFKASAMQLHADASMAQTDQALSTVDKQSPASQQISDTWCRS